MVTSCGILMTDETGPALEINSNYKSSRLVNAESLIDSENLWRGVWRGGPRAQNAWQDLVLIDKYFT